MACLVFSGVKIGLSDSGSLAIFLLVIRRSLSEAWGLALVNCLLKELVISRGECMGLEPKVMGCLPATGLDHFFSHLVSLTFSNICWLEPNLHTPTETAY